MYKYINTLKNIIKDYIFIFEIFVPCAFIINMELLYICLYNYYAIYKSLKIIMLSFKFLCVETDFTIHIRDFKSKLFIIS